MKQRLVNALDDRSARGQDHSSDSRSGFPSLDSCKKSVLSFLVAIRPNREQRAAAFVLGIVLIITISFGVAPHQATVTTRSGSVETLLFRTTAQTCPPANLADPAIKENLQSQSGEDVVLLQWFNGLCNGTYFEMGALDGVRFSNTFFFN